MGIDCNMKENKKLNIDPIKPIYYFNSINSHKDKTSKKYHYNTLNFNFNITKFNQIIELFSGQIATGSYDNTIKIWNIFTFECEKTIHEKGNVFYLLQYKHNLLLSGTDKNIIHLWEINNPNNNSLCEYKGHSL